MEEIVFPETRVLDCGHCGNRTPHQLATEYSCSRVYDDIGDDRPWLERYSWLGYACGTCGGLNVYGDFYDVDRGGRFGETRLHPRASELLPPSHMMSPHDPVPAHILKLYAEVWPLRHRAPAAFAAQVRRALEYVCEDLGASGDSLSARLQDLVSKGVFPGHLGDVTDLLRQIGNLGAHATETEVTVYDAELIDDFFRSVVDYVYVAPAKVNRMRERFSRRSAL